MKTLAACASAFLLATSALAGCAATPGPEPSPGTATLRLGETTRLAGLAVRALRIEEDSRCPSNVQCVHAGTVRLAVALEGREAVLRFDEPLEAAPGRWLRLAAVCPAPRAPGPIERSAYRFTISAALGAPPPPFDFACPSAP